jgi:hypothetical protein
LALPPTTEVNETFLREVDENLRRDRARDFFRDYRGLLIGALILFLATAGGIIWWQQRQVAKAGEQVEELAKIYRDIGESKLATVPARLDQLSSSSNEAVRASALFTRAAIALQQNDTALASKIFGQIANDSSLPQPYRDAALLRQTTIDFDKLKPEDVIARMAPLAKPESPWFGSAGEVTALALVKQGKTLEAGKLFAAIAANKEVPIGLRARAVQIAGSLGVDASAALPPPTQ